MKKLVLGFLLNLGISSTLFAEIDLIALATNNGCIKQDTTTSKFKI